MATFNSLLYTGETGSPGASVNANFPLAKNAWGKLRYVQIPYIIVGTEVTGDFIRLCKMKPGSRILASECKLLGQNPGTTLTVSVGDLVDNNRYMAASAALGGAVINLQTFAAAPGTDLYVPSDIAIPAPGAVDTSVIVAKFVTGATLTATAKLLFIIAFVDE